MLSYLIIILFPLGVTKEHGPLSLDGNVGDVSSSPQSIVDQLNYAKTIIHVDLKLLKKEFKHEIAVRRAMLSRPLIDFQSLLTSMGRRLSKEMIDQCSISYYFITLLHLCNEDNWVLVSQSITNLTVNIGEQ